MEEKRFQVSLVGVGAMVPLMRSIGISLRVLLIVMVWVACAGVARGGCAITASLTSDSGSVGVVARVLSFLMDMGLDLMGWSYYVYLKGYVVGLFYFAVSFYSGQEANDDMYVEVDSRQGYSYTIYRHPQGYPLCEGWSCGLKNKLGLEFDVFYQDLVVSDYFGYLEH